MNIHIYSHWHILFLLLFILNYSKLCFPALRFRSGYKEQIPLHGESLLLHVQDSAHHSCYGSRRYLSSCPAVHIETTLATVEDMPGASRYRPCHNVGILGNYSIQMNMNNKSQQSTTRIMTRLVDDHYQTKKTSCSTYSANRSWNKSLSLNFIFPVCNPQKVQRFAIGWVKVCIDILQLYAIFWSYWMRSVGI